ncbi:hypothetical protein VTO58DRAFT_108495 [Aureobasidium pullulans]
MRSSARALKFAYGIDGHFTPHDPQLYETITNNFLFGDLLRSRVIEIRCFVKEHKGRLRYVLELQFHSSFWVKYTLSGHDKKRQIALENPDVPRVIFDLTSAMAERLERTFKSRYRIESHRPSSHRIKNWSISSDSVGVAVQFEEPLSSITLSVVALVYGGLHLVAWNAPFNTRIEGILWKISGISVASIGPVSIVYTGWHCGLAPYLRSHRFNESTRLLMRFENIITWMGLLLTTGYLLL